MDDNIFEVKTETGSSIEVYDSQGRLGIFLSRPGDCMSFELEFGEAKGLHKAIGEWIGE